MQNFDQFNQEPEFVLNKAIFAKTGTYNDMVQRPYQTNFSDASLVNSFYESTNQGTNINSSTISGVANQFIKPSAQKFNIQNIEEGWGAPRFRFILDITKKDPFGAAGIRKIIQGYTDTAEVAIGYHNEVFPDPNMKLFFNNVISLRETIVNTAYGPRTQTFIAEANHLLRGDLGGHSDFTNPNACITMTPQDVFYSMQKQSFSGQMDNQMDVVDARNAFSMHQVKKSRRQNSSAGHYLSDILNAYSGGNGMVSYNDAMDESDGIRKSIGMVKENAIYQDDFLNLFSNNASGFGDHGNITYGDLNSKFLNLDNVTKIVLDTTVNKTNKPNPLMDVHQRGQTQHWQGADTETIWATSLSNSVPSIMMDLMFTKISFLTTNRITNNAAGRFDTKIIWGESFVDNFDISVNFQNFINRLEFEILEGVTRNNLIDFSLEMHVDLVGETKMYISIQGQPAVPFASPSFCDSLMAPVLANDANILETNSYDLRHLAEGLEPDVHYTNQPSHVEWDPSI